VTGIAFVASFSIFKNSERLRGSFDLSSSESLATATPSVVDLVEHADRLEQELELLQKLDAVHVYGAEEEHPPDVPAK